MSKIKVVQNDFSGGVTGEIGQYKDSQLTTIQNSRNLISGRSKSLRTIPGVTDTPLNILPTDKYLNFTYKGRVYHLIYDTLCKSRWPWYRRSTPLTDSKPFTLGGYSTQIINQFRSSLKENSILGNKYLGLTPVFKLDASGSNLNIHSPWGSMRGVTSFTEDDAIETAWGIPRHLKSMSLDDSNDEFIKDRVSSSSVEDSFNRYNRYLLSWYQYHIAFTPTHYEIDDISPTNNPSVPLYGSKSLTDIWDATFTRQDSTYLYTRFILYNDNFELISKSIIRPRYAKEDSGEPELGDQTKTWETQMFPTSGQSKDLHLKRSQLFGNSTSVYAPAIGADNVILYSNDGSLPPLALNINNEGTLGDPVDLRVFYHAEMFGGVKLQSYLSSTDIKSIKDSELVTAIGSSYSLGSRDFNSVNGETLHTQESIKLQRLASSWPTLPYLGDRADNKIVSNNRSPFFNPGIEVRTPLEETGGTSRLTDTIGFLYSLRASKDSNQASVLQIVESSYGPGFQLLWGRSHLACINLVGERVPIDIGLQVVGGSNSTYLFESGFRDNSGNLQGDRFDHKLENAWFIRTDGAKRGLSIAERTDDLRSHSGGGANVRRSLDIRAVTPDKVILNVVMFDREQPKNNNSVAITAAFGTVNTFQNNLMGVTPPFISAALHIQARLVIAGFSTRPNLYVFSKNLTVGNSGLEFVGIRIFIDESTRPTTETNFGGVIPIVTREGLSIRWVQHIVDSGRTKLRVGTDAQIIDYELLDPSDTGALGDTTPSALEAPQVLYNNEYFLSEDGKTLYYKRFDFNYDSRRYLDMTQQLRPDFIGKIGRFAIEPANGLVFIATSTHLLVAEVVQTRDTLGFFPLDFGGNPLSWDIERGILYFSTGKKIAQWNPSGDAPYNLDKKPYARLKSPNAYKVLAENIHTDAKPTSSTMEIHGELPESVHRLSTGKRSIKGNKEETRNNAVKFKGGDNPGLFIEDTSTPTEITAIIQDIGI